MLYAVFLRGINVGGNKKVPMKELKSLLENAGFSGVRTLLASGNLLVSAKKAPPGKIAGQLAGTIREHFGFDVPVLVREFKRIEQMLRKPPFKGAEKPGVLRYATFLAKPGRKPDSTPEGMEFLRMEGDVFYWTLDTRVAGSVDAMQFIDRVYGKDVTTRNWNTIQKLAELCAK